MSFVVCDEAQHRFFVGMYWPFDYCVARCFTSWPELADRFDDQAQAEDVASYLRSSGRCAEVYGSH